MDRLPTSDELGEMLEKGEISLEEATEIMAQRARMEAFGAMNRQLGGAAGAPQYRSDGSAPGRELVRTLILIVGGIVAALAVVGYVLHRLLASAPQVP